MRSYNGAPYSGQIIFFNKVVEVINSGIHFFNPKTSFVLAQKLLVRNWISAVILSKRKKIGTLNFIFCTDHYLLKLNKSYLKHSTLTDIITFDYTVKNCISGDIFISIDRVKQNAKLLKISFKDELHRVMIHGVLHLCGYGDKSLPPKTIMRKQEDKCLSLRTF
jgi:probable rRNA maturation factor